MGVGSWRLSPVVFSKLAFKRALAGRKVPKRRRPSRMLQPSAAEANYVSFANVLVRELSARYREKLVARLEELWGAAHLEHERRDAAYTDTLADIMAGLAAFTSELTKSPTVEAKAREVHAQVSALSGIQVAKQVQDVAGVAVPTIVPGGQAAADAFVAGNVALISSIGREQHDKIEALVRQGLASGRGVGDLRADIEQRFDVTRSRAELIARDQTLKAYGQITEARHRSLGIAKFIWRTSGDERVRGNPNGKYPPRSGQHNHWALEGQIFEYGKAPYGGPGRDFQCRCTAEPYLDELLADESPTHSEQGPADTGTPAASTYSEGAASPAREPAPELEPETPIVWWLSARPKIKPEPLPVVNESYATEGEARSAGLELVRRGYTQVSYRAYRGAETVAGTLTVLAGR